MGTGEWVTGDISRVQKMCSQAEFKETGKRYRNVTRIANYEIQEETIGQYTGLEDGNYREIFEGDILEFRDTDGYRHLKTVVFDKGAFCFKHTESNGLTPLKSHQWWKYTVVGNIYDSIN